MGTTRILIVEDLALGRLGLRMIFGGQPDLRVVGEEADGKSALFRFFRSKPDVVLMEASLARNDMVCARLVILAPRFRAKLLLMDLHDCGVSPQEWRVYSRSIRAFDFIPSGTTAEQLRMAVRRAAASLAARIPKKHSRRPAPGA
jgi:chemotaxis response regulator CheB